MPDISQGKPIILDVNCRAERYTFIDLAAIRWRNEITKNMRHSSLSGSWKGVPVCKQNIWNARRPDVYVERVVGANEADKTRFRSWAKYPMLRLVGL